MSLVTPTILSEGTPISAEIAVLSIDVRRELNRISDATLELSDGDSAKRTFSLSESAVFKPGAQVEIKLRYEGVPDSESSVFKGVVVRLTIEAGVSGSRLRVELRSSAFLMTHGRKTQVFRDMKDDAVIKKLVGDNEVPIGVVEATSVSHKELVQYHCTDWDFIVRRAEANGLVVYEEEGKLFAKKLTAPANASITLEYGLSEIYDFELELDALAQSPSVSASAWDPKTQKVNLSKASEAGSAWGDLAPKTVAGTLGFKTNVLRHMVPIPDAEAKAWGDGRAMRQRFAYVRGRVCILGQGNLKLLDVIKLTGVGSRFNGKGLISGIRHRVSEDGWRTDLQFGMPESTWDAGSSERDLPAAGLLPGVRGVQIGIVAQAHDDPEKEFRVQVLLPTVEGDASVGVWARILSLDAGPKRGWYVMPEVGDEVLVAFLNNDPRHPIVVGSLYSSKNAAPEDLAPVDDKNLKKGYVSRAGTKLWFNDADKPSFTVETAGGNKIVLDDDAKSVSLADANGNKIILNKDGITLESGKDLKLTASSGKVEITGTEVDVK